MKFEAELIGGAPLCAPTKHQKGSFAAARTGGDDGGCTPGRTQEAVRAEVTAELKRSWRV